MGAKGKTIDPTCLLTKSANSTSIAFTGNVKMSRVSMYTYPICLVNSCCLHETIVKVETAYRVYLPSPPNQLALFVGDNF